MRFVEPPVIAFEIFAAGELTWNISTEASAAIINVRVVVARVQLQNAVFRTV
jgi:hypothetical protein